jgi:hypothetical protein
MPTSPSRGGALGMTMTTPMLRALVPRHLATASLLASLACKATSATDDDTDASETSATESNAVRTPTTSMTQTKTPRDLNYPIGGISAADATIPAAGRPSYPMSPM